MGEEAFRRIKEATGVSDVNEVIQKFLTQEDTQNNLMNLSKENQNKIDQLTEERRKLRAQVEDLKFSGGGNIGRKQVVDDFETHLTEATSKFERNRGKYERMAMVLINMKAGINHIADKLKHIKLDGESPIEMSDEPVEEGLSQCELKLSKLMSLTHLDQQPGRRQLKIDTAGYEEICLANPSQTSGSNSLTRIKMVMKTMMTSRKRWTKTSGTGSTSSTIQSRFLRNSTRRTVRKRRKGSRQNKLCGLRGLKKVIVSFACILGDLALRFILSFICLYFLHVTMNRSPSSDLQMFACAASLKK